MAFSRAAFSMTASISAAAMAAFFLASCAATAASRAAAIVRLGAMVTRT